MKTNQNKNDGIKDHSTQIIIILGIITILLLCFWIYILWSKHGNLPWYNDLLSVSTPSFFFALIVMFFQNKFQKKIYERYSFFRSLKKHGIKNMHHGKQETLSRWIRNAKNEICITGYRLIVTLNLLDDLIFALKKSKGLKVKILTCPPWSDTYMKIFNDDSSTNYLLVLNKLRENIPNFDKRISIKVTDKPLFNDTYIVDNYLITSPYMHNLVRENEKSSLITADEYFSIEVAEGSRLFRFFKEDFISVWESNETKDINPAFKPFNAKEIEGRLI